MVAECYDVCAVLFSRCTDDIVRSSLLANNGAGSGLVYNMDNFGPPDDNDDDNDSDEETDELNAAEVGLV
jgi:hypothetical protein